MDEGEILLDENNHNISETSSSAKFAFADSDVKMHDMEGTPKVSQHDIDAVAARESEEFQFDLRVPGVNGMNLNLNTKRVDTEDSSNVQGSRVRIVGSEHAQELKNARKRIAELETQLKGYTAQLPRTQASRGTGKPEKRLHSSQAEDAGNEDGRHDMMEIPAEDVETVLDVQDKREEEFASLRRFWMSVTADSDGKWTGIQKENYLRERWKEISTQEEAQQGEASKKELYLFLLKRHFDCLINLRAQLEGEHTEVLNRQLKAKDEEMTSKIKRETLAVYDRLERLMADPTLDENDPTLTTNEKSVYLAARTQQDNVLEEVKTFIELMYEDKVGETHVDGRPDLYTFLLEQHHNFLEQTNTKSSEEHEQKVDTIYSRLESLLGDPSLDENNPRLTREEKLICLAARKQQEAALEQVRAELETTTRTNEEASEEHETKIEGIYRRLERLLTESTLDLNDPTITTNERRVYLAARKQREAALELVKTDMEMATRSHEEISEKHKTEVEGIYRRLESILTQPTLNESDLTVTANEKRVYVAVRRQQEAALEQVTTGLEMDTRIQKNEAHKGEVEEIYHRLEGLITEPALDLDDVSPQIDPPAAAAFKYSIGQPTLTPNEKNVYLAARMQQDNVLEEVKTFIELMYEDKVVRLQFAARVRAVTEYTGQEETHVDGRPDLYTFLLEQHRNFLEQTNQKSSEEHQQKVDKIYSRLESLLGDPSLNENDPRLTHREKLVYFAMHKQQEAILERAKGELETATRTKNIEEHEKEIERIYTHLEGLLAEPVLNESDSTIATNEMRVFLAARKQQEAALEQVKAELEAATRSREETSEKKHKTEIEGIYRRLEDLLTKPVLDSNDSTVTANEKRVHLAARKQQETALERVRAELETATRSNEETSKKHKTEVKEIYRRLEGLITEPALDLDDVSPQIDPPAAAAFKYSIGQPTLTPNEKNVYLAARMQQDNVLEEVKTFIELMYEDKVVRLQFASRVRAVTEYTGQEETHVDGRPDLYTFLLEQHRNFLEQTNQKSSEEHQQKVDKIYSRLESLLGDPSLNENDPRLTHREKLVYFAMHKQQEAILERAKGELETATREASEEHQEDLEGMYSRLEDLLQKPALDENDPTITTNEKRVYDAVRKQQEAAFEQVRAELMTATRTDKDASEQHQAKLEGIYSRLEGLMQEPTLNENDPRFSTEEKNVYLAARTQQDNVLEEVKTFIELMYEDKVVRLQFAARVRAVTEYTGQEETHVDGRPDLYTFLLEQHHNFLEQTNQKSSEEHQQKVDKIYSRLESLLGDPSLNENDPRLTQEEKLVYLAARKQQEDVFKGIEDFMTLMYEDKAEETHIAHCPNLYKSILKQYELSIERRRSARARDLQVEVERRTSLIFQDLRTVVSETGLEPGALSTRDDLYPVVKEFWDALVAHHRDAQAQNQSPPNSNAPEALEEQWKSQDAAARSLQDCLERLLSESETQRRSLELELKTASSSLTSSLRTQEQLKAQVLVYRSERAKCVSKERFDCLTHDYEKLLSDLGAANDSRQKVENEKEELENRLTRLESGGNPEVSDLQRQLKTAQRARAMAEQSLEAHLRTHRDLIREITALKEQLKENRLPSMPAGASPSRDALPSFSRSQKYTLGGVDVHSAVTFAKNNYPIKRFSDKQQPPLLELLRARLSIKNSLKSRVERAKKQKMARVPNEGGPVLGELFAANESHCYVTGQSLDAVLWDSVLHPPRARQAATTDLTVDIGRRPSSPLEEDSLYGSSDTDRDDTEESSRSVTKKDWLRKGIQPKTFWTEDRQNNEMNQLVRELVLEALHALNLFSAFVRPGVSEERLRQFGEDPTSYGPQTRNTWLDKNGNTTSEILALPWNRSLMFKLCNLGKEIVARCRDRRRFPSIIKWEVEIRERIYRIALDDVHSRPIDENETEEQAWDRMEQAHNNHWDRCAVHNIRRVVRASAFTVNARIDHQKKFLFRIRFSSIMIRISQERQDADAVEFWSLTLQAVELLGKEGMSDEEEGEEMHQAHPGAPQSRRAVRKVLVLNWRNPKFRDFFRRLEEVSGFENKTSPRGRPRLPRVRAQKVVVRSPPKHLHRSFFLDGYLGGLQDWELTELKLKRKDCKIPKFPNAATAPPTAE
ncbi:hypothetical protein AAF712_009342 [Marasmius tenuissimus]|uniref:Uncharacterized protein n=1 Tax=Marasmius tenuissimus TaxID=585030 RepID=A0ABR2ZR93_9AGAR